MTPGGRALLERSELLLDHARQALAYRWSRTNSLSGAAQEQARRNICDDFAAVLRELAMSMLPALDGTVADRVPVELEPVLQRLADFAAPGWGSRVILYAADALNYSIERHDDPIGSLAPTLAPALSVAATAEGPYLFLRIPSVERDTATLHAIILGHEIGHLRDWALGLSASVKTPPPDSWCDSAGQLQLEHVAGFQRYAFIAAHWTAEVVADILAAQLLGPASLCAFGELIGNLAIWGTDSTTHPAPDRRAAIIIEVLEGLGYMDVTELRPLLKHYEAESQAAAQRRAAAFGVPPHEADELAWQLVHSEVPRLITACAAASQPGERFSASDWPRVEEARGLLSSGRPCGEVIRPGPTPEEVPDAVIINAGWLARLDGMVELAGILGLDASIPNQTSQVSAVLDGLVLKSFEIAEHRRKTPWS